MTQQLLRTRYSPHEGQISVHTLNAKEKWVEAARRWGKSRCALGELEAAYYESLERPIEYINKYQLVPPGFHAWVVAPSYVQGRQAWNEMLQLLNPDWIRETNQANMTITLNGPSEEVWGLIELKSADNAQSLQTVGLDFLWVSEAQDIPNVAAEKLRPTLRQAGRMGKAIYEGIPSIYPEHWFRRGCMAAERGAHKNHRYFHFTVYQNPLLNADDVEEVEGDKEVMPESAWRRMYLADFSLSAGFFSNIEECINGDLLEAPLIGKNYVAGLDLGVSRDFTVLIIMDADERRVVYHRFWDSESWTQVQNHIVAINQEWGIQRMVADATGMGRAMVEDLMAYNMPVEGISLQKNIREEVLANLTVAMEHKTIEFPAIPIMLRQLRAFQHIRMANGQFKAQAPAGEHDDEVFALALALSACNEPQGQVSRNRGFGRRYLPTQAEANTGYGMMGMSPGEKHMRERRLKRVEERWDKAGVDL